MTGAVEVSGGGDTARGGVSGGRKNIFARGFTGSNEHGVILSSDRANDQIKVGPDNRAND